MKILDQLNTRLARTFIKDFDDTDNQTVRVQHGILAGWVSIFAILLLFVLKMGLGIMADSISVVANAFHLLSHLVNSVILVVSFRLAGRPATAKTPFGHGRMEHVVPLIMAIFLFVSGIQIGENSVHQTLEPHEVHYWNALPWILFATIIVKQWLTRFVRLLGKRINSHAIMTTAAHHNIEAVISVTVIAGLVAGHYFHRPELDGYIGIVVSIWLFYLGFAHGREAIVPLLGQAPSREMLQKIRETAKSTEGVEDVHEIIVHNYGSLNTLSMHVEIPEKYGPAEMHEIAESCEWKLRKKFGGEVVCHTDPLMEKTPEIMAIEDQFNKVLASFAVVIDYHDFRVVAASREKIVLVADIDVSEDVPESEFETIAKELEERCKEEIPNIEYCKFYITPKYAY